MAWKKKVNNSDFIDYCTQWLSIGSSFVDKKLFGFKEKERNGVTCVNFSFSNGLYRLSYLSML